MLFYLFIVLFCMSDVHGSKYPAPGARYEVYGSKYFAAERRKKSEKDFIESGFENARQDEFQKEEAEKSKKEGQSAGESTSKSAGAKSKGNASKKS